MLVDFVDGAAKFVEQIVVSSGAYGIVLIAFLENMFPPTPSEFLYPLAGKLAYDGKLSIWIIVFAGTVGSLIGATLYYYLGYHLGNDRIRTMIEKYGTIKIWRMSLEVVTVQSYDSGIMLFQRHGNKIVFIARIMPLVHGVISIPAGVVRMPFGIFLVYTALGAIAWIAPLTILGYWLGDNWERLLAWIDIYQNLWYFLMVMFAVYYIVRQLKKKRNENRL